LDSSIRKLRQVVPLDLWMMESLRSVPVATAERFVIASELLGIDPIGLAHRPRSISLRGRFKQLFERVPGNRRVGPDHKLSQAATAISASLRATDRSATNRARHRRAAAARWSGSRELECFRLLP
jgi:hypothetical protein